MNEDTLRVTAAVSDRYRIDRELGQGGMATVYLAEDLAMVGWVRDQTKMTEMDAYQFVSQTARAPIIQLVDPEYTVLVKLAKAWLPR